MVRRPPHPGSSASLALSRPSLTDPDTVYAGVEDAALSLDRRREKLQGTRGLPATAPAHTGSPALADVSAHHHSRSQRSQPDLHCDFRCGRVFRQPMPPDVEADQPRPAFAYIPDPNALRLATAFTMSAMHSSRQVCFFMQKHWDVMRSDNAGESWEEVSRNLRRFWLRDRRPRARAGDDLRRPHQEATATLPPDGKSARYTEPLRRNSGRADQRLAASDCYGQRARDAMAVDSPRFLWRVFRHHSGQSVRIIRRRRQLGPHRARSSGVLSVEVQTLP